MFSEHMQHFKHTVAIFPIFETGPFLGVRDPTPLLVTRCKVRNNRTIQRTFWDFISNVMTLAQRTRLCVEIGVT